MNTDLLQLKPQPCRVDCGGQVPPPPETMPDAKMTYRCGLSIFGSCPAVKSLTRARQKRRRHLHGLWRRSRRHLRQRIEAMAILTEYPRIREQNPGGRRRQDPRQRRRGRLRHPPVPGAQGPAAAAGSRRPIPVRQEAFYAQGLTSPPITHTGAPNDHHRPDPLPWPPPAATTPTS